MIDVSEFLSPLSFRGITEHHVACHMQDIPENGADVLHFKYVHSYVVDWLKSVRFNWRAKWKRGDDPTLPEMFAHSRKNIHEFKQRIYNNLIVPFPRKEMLSIGNL